jgi:hypothetical protein
MTPNTRRKLQQLANQLNVQVEEIEKPPYEINDNTDDIMEPQPAALLQATMSVRSSKHGRGTYNDENNAPRRGPAAGVLAKQSMLTQSSFGGKNPPP